VTGHPAPALVAAYATGGAAVNDVTAWSIEAHLDRCSACRGVLAASTGADDRALLDRVAAALDAELEAGPVRIGPVRAAPGWSAQVGGGPVMRRALRAASAGGRTRTAWAVVPWLLTALGVLAVAWLSEGVFPGAPSLVLLLAPVAPLLPVAAAWSRGTDPAWELVSSASRSGLGLLLHRTLAVLLAVLPMLALAGWGSGHGIGLWLLPCLAFTTGSLALGGVIGVARAAALLAAAWSAGVVAPSLVNDRLPAVLQPGGWWIWAVATAALAAVLVVRRDDHSRLSSR
jgi:hypothetical protein